MKLARPAEQYNVSDQAQTRALIERADEQNYKTFKDVELVDNKLILRSPSGTRYYLKVDNAGNLSTSAA
ncbi:MAG: hypothetical protein ACO3C4_01800 [Candidatus Limnocylindrus sp.]